MRNLFVSLLVMLHMDSMSLSTDDQTVINDCREQPESSSTSINVSRIHSLSTSLNDDNSSSSLQAGQLSREVLYLLSLLPYPDPEGREVFQPSWDEGPTLYLAE